MSRIQATCASTFATIGPPTGAVKSVELVVILPIFNKFENTDVVTMLGEIDSSDVEKKMPMICRASAAINTDPIKADDLIAT